MSQFYWNAACLGGVFALPAQVADRLLTLATAEQLRVLLWFSRHTEGWDAAACAAQLQMTAAECEGCLRFWVEQGLLTAPDVSAAPVATTPKAAVPRTAAVKPTWKEVLAYQREHQEFSDFLQEVSARLGRPLNHGDNATLLYLITTAGLPQASVLMVVAYAVSLGKASVRYAESLALSWLDEEIVSPEQVDGKIRELQRIRAAAQTVEKLLDLPRALTASQAKMADTWLNGWSFSDEMLRRAYGITMENCKSGFNMKYMDKVLERWYSEGVHTPDRITAVAAPKKKGAAATNPEESSLDNQDLEQQLLRFRPKYKK